MTHLNRKKQLLNTLQSIQNQKDARNLTEIIIVDDVSETSLQLSDFKKFDLDIKLISVQTKDKWWVNPCVAYNTAFNFIHSDKVIIQNAECLHATNIIQFTLDNLKKNQYIAMSALALTKESTMLIDRKTKPDEISREGAKWTNHAKYKPTAYHFCAAIRTSDLKKIGGFDPRFSEGIWYDDNMLLKSLRKNDIEIIIERSQLVFHQWHESIWRNIENHREKMRKNKKLLLSE
jgi:glycosyltransferase involved in cell wall biosynthesis